MLRRILIGVDNTGSSVVALRLGVLWARRSGATLVGLAIVDEPGIRAIEPAWSVGGKPGVDPVYYMGYERRLAAVDNRARQYLDQFGIRCDLEGVAHAEVKRIGSPHEQIREEAQSCDLILLGRGSQFRFITGDDEGDDTLKKVLKDAPRPVVVAPRAPSAEGPVIIAYDGSLQATRALTAFQETGLGESGNVHILTVGATASEASAHAERASKWLSDHEIDSVSHALSAAGPPATVILDQVRRLNAGLIVMGAYGQPALREFFLGSVTRTVLENSPVPLFLYH